MSAATDDRDWIKVDLHIHTLDDPQDVLDYSAHQLLERARSLGFRVLAITLHGVVFDRPEVFADAGIRPLVGTFCCVRGCRPSSTRVIGELAADPHHRGALLALVSAEHAAYRSTNGADSWTPVELDPSESYFKSVRFDPSTPGVLYAVRLVPPPSGVFVWATELVRSDDSGASWTVLPAPLSGVTIAAVALAKGAADHILLGTFRGEREGGVLRSVDGGMTWVAVNQGFSGLDVLAMIAHPTRAGTLLVDASFTSDAGTTWTTPAFLPAGVLT